MDSTIFCTIHRHATLEDSRDCKDAQLRASGDLKLMLAGMPPKPVARHHKPPRIEAKGKVAIFVFTEAAPRDLEDELASEKTDEMYPVHAHPDDADVLPHHEAEPEVSTTKAKRTPRKAKAAAKRAKAKPRVRRTRSKSRKK